MSQTARFAEIPTFDGIYYEFDGSSINRAAVIRMDGGNIHGAKRVDEPRVDAGYAGCDWRIGLRHHELAINLRITGRVAQSWHGSNWIRCEIEWVGDYEPSTFTRAWLRVW